MGIKETKRGIIASFPHTYYPNNSNPSSSNDGTSTFWTDSFSGTDNPQWRAQVKAGVNATTNANWTRRVNRASKAKYEKTLRVTTNPTLGGRWTGMGSWVFSQAIPSVLVPNYSKADTTARIRFIDDYRRTRQGFSTGTFLGELKETLQMIRRPAKALRNGIDAYYGTVKERTRRIRNERVHRRTVGETWLEYQFGWAPLVNDIKDAVNELAGGRDHYLKRLKGSARDDSTGSVKFSQPLGDWSDVQHYFQKISEVSVRYVGAVRADLVSPPTLMDAWGFRLQDVLPVAWELIPYSFLVDYFTNIGDIISAASEGPCYLAWGCRTRRSAVRHIQLASSFKLPVDTSTNKWSGAGTCSGGYHSYITGDRLSIGKVQVGIFDFRWEIPGMSSKKWLNIGALASLRR